MLSATPDGTGMGKSPRTGIKDHPTQVLFGKQPPPAKHTGDVSSLLFLYLPDFGHIRNADAPLSHGSSHLPSSFLHLLVT